MKWRLAEIISKTCLMTPPPSKHSPLKVGRFSTLDVSLPLAGSSCFCLQVLQQRREFSDAPASSSSTGLLPTSTRSAATRSDVPKPRTFHRGSGRAHARRPSLLLSTCTSDGLRVCSTVPLGGLRGCPCGCAPSPVKTFLSHCFPLLAHVTAYRVTICLTRRLPS